MGLLLKLCQIIDMADVVVMVTTICHTTVVSISGYLVRVAIRVMFLLTFV